MRLARGFMGAILAAAIGIGAAGCDTLDSFDMDFLNTKKKLPGERKPVFPQGVPGVTPGVPPEYMKGYDDKAAQATPDAATTAVQQVAPAQEAKPKAAAKPKPKPKPKPVTRQTQPAPAQPAQAQPAPPAAAQQSGPWPQSQPQAAWPTAPNPNQFSR